MESNPQLLAAMRHHILRQEFLQLPAIVREFLPPYDELLTELATLRARHEIAGERPHPNPLPEGERIIAEKEAFLQRVDSLRESNPMLGHRGYRLGLSFPDIYRMQVEAIITAGARLHVAWLVWRMRRDRDAG